MNGIFTVVITIIAVVAVLLSIGWLGFQIAEYNIDVTQMIKDNPDPAKVII